MKLNKYFKDLTEDVRFKDIKDDSRLVKKNDLFFAIRGENYNGEKYISEAIENGASYIISKKNACVISLNKSRKSQRAFKFNA